MKDVINLLKNRKLISENNASNLEDHFSGITGEVFRNQLRNNGKGATGRRYSEEFKQFTSCRRKIGVACIIHPIPFTS